MVGLVDNLGLVLVVVEVPFYLAEGASALFANLLEHEWRAIYGLEVEEVEGEGSVGIDWGEGEHH